MKTGIAMSCGFSAEDARKKLTHVKELGYDCVDFQSFVGTENPFFESSLPDFEKTLGEMRQAMAEIGVEPSQTHGPWRWPPRDFTEEDRKERFEKMTRALYGTALIGAPAMAIHCIMPFGCDKNPEPEQFCEMNLDYYSRLTKEAEKVGVTVALENMPFPALTLSRPSEILAFVKEIGSPNLKVCIDTGHCATLKESPAEAVRLVGKEYLACLHVHDNDGRSDWHWLPFTGTIDWTDFRNALNEIGFEGSVSLETNVKRGDMSESVFRKMESVLSEMAKDLARQA